jgi:hypothetical protein
MIDRIFAAVLTFTILIGATLAFGVEMFGANAPVVTARTAPAHVREIRLERVVVTAKRVPVATHVAATESAAALTE